MNRIENQSSDEEFLMEGISGSVGISAQCRDIPGIRGLHSNGAGDRRDTDFRYDGKTADDPTLGIPAELAGYVNPE